MIVYEEKIVNDNEKGKGYKEKKVSENSKKVIKEKY